MKNTYTAPKAEKMNFDYTENVSASSVICKSGLKKIYTDTGKEMCEDTFLGVIEVWNADNLG